MTRQLLYTRLYEGMHFPMDSWTLGDTLNIQNMGEPPETESDTLPERYLAEQNIRNAAIAMMQAKSQMIMNQANPQTLIQRAIEQDPQNVLQMVLQALQSQGKTGGGAPANGNSGGGSNGATGRPEGHPPSFQEAPSIFQRSDGQGGQRTVLATSDRG